MISAINETRFLSRLSIYLSYSKDKSAILTYKHGVINVDFDGTMTSEESGMEVARLAGKESEAKVLYNHLFSDLKRIVSECESTDQLIRKVNAAYKKYLIEGAKPLRGLPVSKLSEVVCKSNDTFKKITDMARENGRIKIISYTDERIIRNFIEQNRKSMPEDVQVVCSRLEDHKGKLTGRFSRIVSKVDGYTGGDVCEDSAGGIGLCREAHKEGYDIYVVKDGIKTELLEDALKVSGMPYSLILRD